MTVPQLSADRYARWRPHVENVLMRSGMDARDYKNEDPNWCALCETAHHWAITVESGSIWRHSYALVRAFPCLLLLFPVRSPLPIHQVMSLSALDDGTGTEKDEMENITYALGQRLAVGSTVEIESNTYALGQRLAVRSTVESESIVYALGQFGRREHREER